MHPELIGNITAIVLVRNEEDIIDLCLKNLKKYFDNIIVIDMESTDRTVQIAQALEVKILSHPIIDNFDAARNIGIKSANTEWIFINDADEFITENLFCQIKAETKKQEADILKIPRANIHLGKYMVSLSPEYLPRVFKKSALSITESFSGNLHSFYKFKEGAVSLNCQYSYPENCMLHFSNLEIEGLVAKINAYTTIEALQVNKTPIKFQGISVLYAGIKSFFITFMRKKAYKDKYIGFLWSLFDAIYAMLVVIKYHERASNKFNHRMNKRDLFIDNINKTNKSIINGKSN